MPSPSEVIELLMTQLGFSQAELARELQVPQSQISRWRRGTQRPSYGSMERIKLLLGVDMSAPREQILVDAFVHRLWQHTMRVPPDKRQIYLDQVDMLLGQLAHAFTLAAS